MLIAVIFIIFFQDYNQVFTDHRKVTKIIKRMKRELDLLPELEAIKQIIDPQLNANYQINWGTFTFHWDIHPKDHTKIISKDQWFAAGGDFDELGALRPSAFTKQCVTPSLR